MEQIVERMQNETGGVVVRTVKAFMSKVPSVFTGADLIAWIMKNLDVEDITDAVHLAHLLSSHGYLFPIDDHQLTVKNDGTFYRYKKANKNICFLFVSRIVQRNNESKLNNLYNIYLDFKRLIFGHQIVGNRKILIMRFIYVNVQCKIKLV